MAFIVKNTWHHTTEKNLGIQKKTAYDNLFELEMNRDSQTKYDYEKAVPIALKVFGTELSQLKFTQEIC